MSSPKHSGTYGLRTLNTPCSRSRPAQFQVKRMTALTLASERMAGSSSTAYAASRLPNLSSIRPRTSSAVTSDIPFSNSERARRSLGARRRLRASTCPTFCRPGILLTRRSRRCSGAVSAASSNCCDHLGGQAPVREALEEELEGIADQGTPSRGGIGDEDFHRNQAADPLADFAAASTGRAGS